MPLFSSRRLWRRLACTSTTAPACTRPRVGRLTACTSPLRVVLGGVLTAAATAESPFGEVEHKDYEVRKGMKSMLLFKDRFISLNLG